MNRTIKQSNGRISTAMKTIQLMMVFFIGFILASMSVSAAFTDNMEYYLGFADGEPTDMTTNGVAWTPIDAEANGGYIGKGLEYGRAQSTFELSDVAEYGFCLMLNMDGTGGVGIFYEGSNDGFEIDTDSDNDNLALFDGSGFNREYYTPVSSVPASGWVDICVSRDSSGNTDIYSAGELIGTTNAELVLSDGTQSQLNTASDYDIDEFAGWSRHLTQTDVDYYHEKVAVSQLTYPFTEPPAPVSPYVLITNLTTDGTYQVDPDCTRQSGSFTQFCTNFTSSASDATVTLRYFKSDVMVSACSIRESPQGTVLKEGTVTDDTCTLEYVITADTTYSICTDSASDGVPYQSGVLPLSDPQNVLTINDGYFLCLVNGIDERLRQTSPNLVGITEIRVEGVNPSQNTGTDFGANLNSCDQSVYSNFVGFGLLVLLPLLFLSFFIKSKKTGLKATLMAGIIVFLIAISFVLIALVGC